MDSILQKMKKKGLRVTSQKKQVLHALQSKPQTVQTILNSARSKKNMIDKATVYRILTSFVELGIVREIHLGDREARYELANSEHHHHLVCEDCESIEDVSLTEDIFLKEVQKQSAFKVKNHSLEFFGTCKKCQ